MRIFAEWLKILGNHKCHDFWVSRNLLCNMTGIIILESQSPLNNIFSLALAARKLSAVWFRSDAYLTTKEKSLTGHRHYYSWQRRRNQNYYVRRILSDNNAEADHREIYNISHRNDCPFQQTKTENRNNGIWHQVCNFRHSILFLVTAINSRPNACFFYHKCYTCRKFEERKQNHSPFKGVGMKSGEFYICHFSMNILAWAICLCIM